MLSELFASLCGRAQLADSCIYSCVRFLFYDLEIWIYLARFRAAAGHLYLPHTELASPFSLGVKP